MKITSIKQQVKRADRYSIYVDNKYSFSLSEQGLLSANIKLGQEVTNLELKELLDKAEDDKAYMRALDYLSRRPRSRWEVGEYLSRKGYKDNTITTILNKLIKRGYIDDSKFAESWVRSRRALKPISKRKLMYELQQKRISKSIVQTVLEQDDTDEQLVLSDLVARKRQQTKYQDEQKLKAYLVRQGFNFDDINAVLGGR